MTPNTTSDVPLFPWTTMFSVPANQVDRSGDYPAIKPVNPQTPSEAQTYKKQEAQKKTQKVAAKTL